MGTLSQARSSTHIHAVLARLFLSSSVSLSPLLAAPVACVFHDFCFVRVFMFCSRPPISLSLSLSLSLSINLSLHRSSGLRTARPLFRLETKYHNADNTGTHKFDLQLLLCQLPRLPHLAALILVSSSFPNTDSLLKQTNRNGSVPVHSCFLF